MSSYFAHRWANKQPRYGDLWVDLACELDKGISHKTFTCANKPSDADAAMRSSPPFVPRTWSAAGLHVHCLISALLCSCTGGSPGYSKIQLACNGFSVYFLMLLHLQHNRARGRSPNEGISHTTLRNMCSAAAHAVNCCLGSHEPRYMQELGIEMMFSQVKSAFRGNPH